MKKGLVVEVYYSFTMPPKTKLFVGMLPPDCQEFTLRKLFERHGEVVECSVMGSYAFVHMKSEEEALAAIEALNQHDLNGYNISVEVSSTPIVFK